MAILILSYKKENYLFIQKAHENPEILCMLADILQIEYTFKSDK